MYMYACMHVLCVCVCVCVCDASSSIVPHSDTLCVLSALGTAVSVDPQVGGGGGGDDSVVDSAKRCKSKKAEGQCVVVHVHVYTY